MFYIAALSHVEDHWEGGRVEGGAPGSGYLEAQKRRSPSGMTTRRARARARATTTATATADPFAEDNKKSNSKSNGNGESGRALPRAMPTHRWAMNGAPGARQHEGRLVEAAFV